MPTNMTLKGVPDELYEELKASAELNRRSLNNEVISCLERTVLSHRLAAADHIAKAREIRAALGAKVFKPVEIERYKREGRK